MTHEEAERAVRLQVPVVHQGNAYKRISGLIYRRAQNGGTVCRGELKSLCGHSITIAPLHRVDWQDPADRDRTVERPWPEEEEPNWVESRAKRAFQAGELVEYEGQRWTVSAMILRPWMERAYWTSLELSRVSDRLVQEVWNESVTFPP
ncbi:hypothetical protein AALA61_07115 [Oscillospiraceae bacterium 42-9]